MSKLYVQGTEEVWASSAALGVSASVSGSAIALGHAKVVGLLWANASAAEGAGSGLHVLQSNNWGATWDIITASYSVAASTGRSVSADVVGNAVKIQFWNGETAASLMRARFYLRPV